MFLTGNWTFLVDIAGKPPLASEGLCLVNLSSWFYRTSLFPYVDKNGKLNCIIADGSSETAPGTITDVYEYSEDNPMFDCPFFKRVSLVDFVRRLCDSYSLDGKTEDEIAEQKKSLGV